MTEEEHVQKALDVLVKIAELTPQEVSEDRYFEQRQAAEEILRHYREPRMIKDIHITVNGAVPVRPMTRAEVDGV